MKNSLPSSLRFRLILGHNPVIRGPKWPLFRPCIARVFSGYRIFASFALPRSRHGPRNPQIQHCSNPRRPRPGDTPRKFPCGLKSPRTLTNFCFLKMHSFDAAIQVFAKNSEPSQPHVCRISKKNRQPILQIEPKHESKHARAVCELCRHASACARMISLTMKQTKCQKFPLPLRVLLAFVSTCLHLDRLRVRGLAETRSMF